jgi:uncharacterized protein YecE (DUF72 family)
LVPAYADALAAARVVPVLAAWGEMPPLEEQAERTRTGQARALVVRWMLHAGLGYEEAREQYAPFDQLVNEDIPMRTAIARLAVTSWLEGQAVYVTINNKAEGSAPVSAERLARSIVQRLGTGPRPSTGRVEL